MAYDQNIPQPQDVLSASQGDLLGNFQALNTVFSVNHVAFDDTTSNKGKHKFVTLLEQTENPTGTTTDFFVYSKDTNGSPELYGATNSQVFQMTKAGSLYLGCIPVVAVNFDGTGAIQGTALNCSSVSVSSQIYTINFGSTLSDNNYFWNISGFANTSLTPCIAQVVNSNNYNSVATTSSLQVYFLNPSGAKVTPTRASAIIWRFQ